MNFTEIARAVVQHIARYNAQCVDLNSVYVFISIDDSRVEFTTDKTFTTLDNALLFGTLAEIDPSALIREQDADSAFVIDIVTEILTDIEETLETQEQYHLKKKKN